MNELDRTSILRMAMGAIEERVNYEMGRVLDNILDVNTEAKRISLSIREVLEDEALDNVPAADDLGDDFAIPGEDA